MERLVCTSTWRWLGTGELLDGYAPAVIWQIGHRHWGVENRAFNEVTPPVSRRTVRATSRWVAWIGPQVFDPQRKPRPRPAKSNPLIAQVMSRTALRNA